MDSKRRAMIAYISPFALFLILLACEGGIASLGKDSTQFWLREPKYWIYPLQTLLCGITLAYFWKDYSFGSLRAGGWGILVGLLALAIWISPQWLFGAAPRIEGFNPDVFSQDPALYWMTVVARFIRMVVIVALLEEIFWRGFLMRYLINEDFESVAFGTFRTMAFVVVAVMFTFEHGSADRPAAFVTGLLYNGLAVKTKSLFACVVAHAVTNFGLGLYTMATKQWGFW